MTGHKRLTWQGSKKTKRAHYMESETSTFCGRKLLKTKAMPADWKPEDHGECVCKICMEWYRNIGRECTSQTSPHPAPSTPTSPRNASRRPA